MIFNLSREYKTAWEFAQKGKLICQVDYIQDGDHNREAATTTILDKTLIVSGRGIVYVWIPNCDFNFFRKACVENKIEFFLPVQVENLTEIKNKQLTIAAEMQHDIGNHALDQKSLKRRLTDYRSQYLASIKELEKAIADLSD